MGDRINMSRKSPELADLVNKFNAELDAILNHTKIIQTFVAGVREGKLACRDDPAASALLRGNGSHKPD